MSDPLLTSIADLEKNKFVSTGPLKTDVAVKVTNPDGSLVAPISFFSLPYDAITVTYPSATQEVYTSRTGGISGTSVQVLTVNYTDATKANLLNVSVV